MTARKDQALKQHIPDQYISAPIFGEDANRTRR